jgi:MFS family permease
MGAGFGLVLIGSMVVISRWFPPDRFSTLTAMVMSIGLLGNLAATTPLAWASRSSAGAAVFGAAVVFTVLAAITIWLVVRDAPPGHPFLARTPEPPRQMVQGLMEVPRNPRLKPFLALNFCNYAKGLADDIRVVAVALGVGVNVKALRTIVRLRKMKEGHRAEQETILKSARLRCWNSRALACSA